MRRSADWLPQGARNVHQGSVVLAVRCSLNAQVPSSSSVWIESTRFSGVLADLVPSGW